MNSYISDFRLLGPANESDNRIYGILPYIAPEVMKGESHTLSSDIYCFGIIMVELSSGKPPFYDRKHDSNLALDICNGLRPEFGEKTPEIYKTLAHKCMNANPKQRPKADELEKILSFWCRSIYGEIFSYKGKAINVQFRDDDDETLTNYPTLYKTDMYISQKFSFNNIPIPVNITSYLEYMDNKGTVYILLF